MTRTPGLRGLLPPKETNLPRLHELKTDRGVLLPRAVDVSHGWTDWLMLGNGPDPTLTINNGQPVGDCFWAGWEHGRIAKALVVAANGVSLPSDFQMPTANETVGYYFAYETGATPGTIATSGPDNGTVLADGLHWLHQGGLITRYGPVDHTDQHAVKEAVIAHKGVILGVALDEFAEEEFAEHKVWREHPEKVDPLVGGHAIYKIGYTPTTYTDLTWGADQETTVEWDQDQVQECFWFQLPDEPDAPGYDFWPLDAALKAI